MRKKKSKKKFVVVKKTLKNFMQDEDGFIAKDKILKIGLGTMSAIGILGSMNAYAYTQQIDASNTIESLDMNLEMNIPTHSNGLSWQNIPGSNCEELVNHDQMIPGTPTWVNVSRVQGEVTKAYYLYHPTKYHVTIS